MLNRLSSASISSAQPNLLVSLTNILGNPVKQVQFGVEAESGKNLKKSSEVLATANKKPFASKSSDGSTYEIKLVDAQQPPSAGFYSIAVNVAPKAPANADKRFFLVVKSVEVKLTTQANVADIQIGVADRDQSAPKLQK